MIFEFPCPWCGGESQVRGSNTASWRFRMPCELCNRDMVITWDGGMVISRAPQRMARSDEATARIRLAKAG